MEPQRRNLVAMCAVGMLLVAVGAFSHSWLSGNVEGSTVKIGLLGGTACNSGECQSIELDSLGDINFYYVAIVGIVAALASIGVAGYEIFLLAKRREAQIDPKRLGMPAGLGAAAAIIFYLIKPSGVHSGLSWSGPVALVGYGTCAAALFLSKRWLTGAPAAWGHPPQWQGGYAPPQALPPAGYAPPAQPHGGYAPPTQPQGGHGGYAPPQRPVQVVQQIQPIMPAQPMMPQQPAMPAPQAGHIASQPGVPGYGQPYGAPGSYPPQPMMPQRPTSSSQPPVSTMSSQPSTIPPGQNPCPRCGTGLAYSSQYGKWYCARCREYL